MQHLVTPRASAPLRRLLLALAWLLALSRPALAAPAPPAGTPAARPLAAALNPNGTLRAGLHGSFDPTGYVLGRDAASGQPAFRLARPAGAAKAAKVASNLGAGDEYWQDGFGIPGANGDVYATAVAANGDVYVGGQFTVVGTTMASRVARWDATAGTWSALGAGVSNNTVLALAVAGADLYVGGTFSQAGGAVANHVAKWNATTGTWSPLGAGVSGFNGTVNALAVAGADVYAGGSFSQAGGAPASNVARWNATTGTWSPLGTGLNGYPSALAATGSTLYAGGGFTTVGDGSKVTAFFGIYDPTRPSATAAALTAAQVALYPNPAPRAGGVTVALPVAAGQRATATVLDALGRVVRPAQALAVAAGQATGTLPTAGLAPGVYTVRLSTGAGTVSKRLVVE